jgi:hypothetical protein
VSKNHKTTAANMTVEHNIHPEEPVSTKKKQPDESFTNPTSMEQLQLLNP